MAMLGIGSSVGRVAIGPIADKVGRMRMFRVSMFLAAVTMACWPACSDVTSLLLFAFFYAFFAGGFIAQAPVVAGDLWGVSNVGGTFALVNLAMVCEIKIQNTFLHKLTFEKTGPRWFSKWPSCRCDLRYLWKFVGSYLGRSGIYVGSFTVFVNGEQGRKCNTGHSGIV